MPNVTQMIKGAGSWIAQVLCSGLIAKSVTELTFNSADKKISSYGILLGIGVNTAWNRGPIQSKWVKGAIAIPVLGYIVPKIGLEATLIATGMIGLNCFGNPGPFAVAVGFINGIEMPFEKLMIAMAPYLDFDLLDQVTMRRS